MVLVSWGTSLLIFSHYINWPFDPNLSPAPPFFPPSNLQPKCLPVHNCLILLEGLMGHLEAFCKSKIRCHHIALHLLFWWNAIIWHDFPHSAGLTGDSLRCCDYYWWPCSLLLVTCWLLWSGGLRWGKNLRRVVCGREKGGTGKGRWALSLACLYNISVSMSGCHLRNKSRRGNWFKALPTMIK